MSSHLDEPQPVARTFSSIDDGLNLLLADLKQEDGSAQHREAPISLASFTPFLKMGSLDCDPLSRLASPPGGGPGTAASPAHLLAASAGCYTLLKGPGSCGTPLVVPTTFIPVSTAPPKAAGGKHRPAGGGQPLLHSGHQAVTSPSAFTIPAYGRTFSQLDFISPEEFANGAAPGSSSGAGGVFGRATTGLAEFGELADESRLGELPSEDDLKLLLFDPAMQQGLAAVRHGSYGGAAMQQALAAHQQQQQQQQAGGSLMPNSSSRSSITLVDVGQPQSAAAAAAAAAGLTGLSGGFSPPVVLRIKTGAGAPAGARSVLADVSAASRQHSPKRRAERMETDERVRGSKRLSGSTAGWSEASEEGGSGGSTPSSAAGGEAAALHQAWFLGHHHHQSWGASGAGSSLLPTRFSVEHGRRQAGRGSSESEDPSYTPSREKGRAAGTSRQYQQQQQQYYQQYHHQQYHQASDAEDEAPVVVVQQQKQQQQYRGVSRHRLTQRWEASLWLNGRQLYLGGFNSQEDAAHAYDLAALACKGMDAQINFAPESYAQQLQEIAGYTRDEVVAYVRRRSSAFSRGKSRYRGVSGHNGRWEARIGSFNGRKNVSFGVFDSEEGAARQYDRALILEKGRTAKTNFPIRDYDAEVAEYERYLLTTCGSTHGPLAQQEARTVTLPRNREATADEKKRAAVIYADALLRALRQPAQGARGGRA